MTFADVNGPCTQHKCEHGAICVEKDGRASCQCPSCSEEYKPVSATLHKSYLYPADIIYS